MNAQSTTSPIIHDISWAYMRVAGIGEGKDFKLWPGGGRAWDWSETGTHHVPGIQPADVSELLDHGSRTIVLSRGMLLRLQTCPETFDLLRRREIDVRVEETRAAARVYNELAAAGEAVGGLFHSTC